MEKKIDDSNEDKRQADDRTNAGRDSNPPLTRNSQCH